MEYYCGDVEYIPGEYRRGRRQRRLARRPVRHWLDGVNSGGDLPDMF